MIIGDQTPTNEGFVKFLFGTMFKIRPRIHQSIKISPSVLEETQGLICVVVTALASFA
jgi:hypothetical protein